MSRVSIRHETAAAVPPLVVIPPWVLPFMRLLRGPCRGDFADARARLDYHLPTGVRLPKVETAAIVLIRLGIA